MIGLVGMTIFVRCALVWRCTQIVTFFPSIVNGSTFTWLPNFPPFCP